MHNKIKVFIEIDGPVVNAQQRVNETGFTEDQLNDMFGAYLFYPETDQSIEAIRTLMRMNYDVHLIARSPSKLSHCHLYLHKAQWVAGKLPELNKKLITINDYSIISGANDILIYPNEKSSNGFNGISIEFTKDTEWSFIVELIEQVRVMRESLSAKSNFIQLAESGTGASN